jgi:hypothetical protein
LDTRPVRAPASWRFMSRIPPETTDIAHPD